jgi:hypothetical protein
VSLSICYPSRPVLVQPHLIASASSHIHPTSSAVYIRHSSSHPPHLFFFSFLFLFVFLVVSFPAFVLLIPIIHTARPPPHCPFTLCFPRSGPYLRCAPLLCPPRLLLIHLEPPSDLPRWRCFPNTFRCWLQKSKPGGIWRKHLCAT